MRRTARYALALAMLLMLSACMVFAADPPRDALRYQRDLTRAAHTVWGLDAPVATFAAQIHQESGWRADARSAVGAQGIAQFMPSTSTWISGAYPLGPPQPNNPAWAMRAMVTYNRHLWDRVQAAEGCSRAAMMLSAYNGGLAWIYKDQKLAREQGIAPLIWFGQLEKINAGRSPANFRENRDYPRQILLKWQPLYARWGGSIQCA